MKLLRNNEWTLSVREGNVLGTIYEDTRTKSGAITASLLADNNNSNED